MISPFKRLCHWGPSLSLVICSSITVSTLDTSLNYLVSLLFQASMCLCLYNMWSASFLGPGTYTKQTLERRIRRRSQTFKTPQEISDKTSSLLSGKFCRRCCHIVLNRHHHCIWLNNCVGRDNEKHFLRFLKLGLLVSLESMAILSFDAYHQCTTQACIMFKAMNVGLSLGVCMSMSALLYTH